MRDLQGELHQQQPLLEWEQRQTNFAAALVADLPEKQEGFD
jgi:hypothetical protein